MKQSMSSVPIQVYIVDDESSIRAAYTRLVRSAKMEPHSFSTVDEFMRAKLSDENACIVSDVRMPGRSGLELPRLLADAGRHVPVIIVTAHDTPEIRDIAQLTGAVAYFRKPVDDQALLDAIVWAISRQLHA